MYIEQSEQNTFENCEFKDNRLEVKKGAGLFIDTCKNTDLINFKFINNFAYAGSGFLV